MRSNDDSLLISVVDPSTGCSVFFEDDGVVAYAYLLSTDSRIIADVWLYNRCRTPEQPEWNDPNDMPFANSAKFIRTDKAYKFVEQPEDVIVLWEASERHGLIARIYLHRDLFAILTPGAKPGWCALAAMNNPLAKVFTAEFGGLPD